MRAWHSSVACLETWVRDFCAELLLAHRCYSCVSLFRGFLVVARLFWMVVHRLRTFVGCWGYLNAPCPSFVVDYFSSFPVLCLFWEWQRNHPLTSLSVLVCLSCSRWARQFKFSWASISIHFQQCACRTRDQGHRTLVDRRHVERIVRQSQTFCFLPSLVG